MRVEAYRNLHTESLSVRQVGGRVFTRPQVAFIEAPSFVVQPAGRQKVLDTGVKNVHAFVRGEVRLPHEVPLSILRSYGKWRRADYNPRKAATFTDRRTGEPVTNAAEAVVTTRGVFYR